MRLTWLTDIHLDFLDEPQRARYAAEVDAAGGAHVVITGDIANGRSVVERLGELAAAVTAPVWFVLGNHDFYRSSVEKVRGRMRALSDGSGRLAWLPARGVIHLSDTVALLGHDGWGDARLGNVAGTPVMLNDFLLIDELSRLRGAALHARLQALGDDAAAYLREVVAEALTWARHLVVAIHVPPFREACWHEGAVSSDDWLPYFTCHAAGEVLRAAMAARPDARMTVLCGHTHSGGEVQILPNLRVLTGAADYGAPVVRTLEV